MMSAADVVSLPLPLAYGGLGLGVVITALVAAQFLFSLRRAAQFRALTAQLERTGHSLEQDAHASQEATQALRNQLGEALDQLREARDKASRADRANQAKSAFVAMVSHELRTPLSAIIGFAEMIEQQAMGPIGNDKYSGYATDIRESGQHLLGIINDILDLSKVEAGKETLNEQVIASDDLMNRIRVLLDGRPQAAGVELVFDCAEDLPAIYADKRRLTQILVNLLSNAIKFTPEGGIVRLHCWATAESGFVFQAIDNGVGIPGDKIAQAMSVFGQVENEAKAQEKGTGLGLPLAKALAELHGGTLDLQSELGKGTTVTLRLPARRIVSPTGSQTAAPPQLAAG